MNIEKRYSAKTIKSNLKAIKTVKELITEQMKRVAMSYIHERAYNKVADKYNLRKIENVDVDDSFDVDDDDSFDLEIEANSEKYKDEIMEIIQQEEKISLEGNDEFEYLTSIINHLDVLSMMEEISRN